MFFNLILNIKLNNTKDVLSIVLNGEKYLIPLEFAKQSELLSKYVDSKETLFLYEDKNTFNKLIMYWNKYKDEYKDNFTPSRKADNFLYGINNACINTKEFKILKQLIDVLFKNKKIEIENEIEKFTNICKIDINEKIDIIKSKMTNENELVKGIVLELKVKY